jgi:hypothetical protein
MKNAQRNWSKVTRVTSRNIEFLPLPDNDLGFVVCRMASRAEDESLVNLQDESQRKKYDVEMSEGICLKSELDAILRGQGQLRMSRSYFTTRDGNHTIFKLVTQEYLDIVQSVGYGYMDVYDKLSACECEKPFAAIEKGKKLILIEEYNYNHLIFDAKGLPLPAGRHYDYMNGSFTEGRYDLKKAAEILAAHPDIILDDPDDPIQRVPYYNAGEHCTTHIPFKWVPPVDIYRKVADYEKGKPGQFSMTKGKAEFDLDVFGLVAGGATLYKNFADDPRYMWDEDQHER